MCMTFFLCRKLASVRDFFLCRKLASFVHCSHHLPPRALLTTALAHSWHKLHAVCASCAFGIIHSGVVHCVQIACRKPRTVCTLFALVSSMPFQGLHFPKIVAPLVHCSQKVIYHWRIVLTYGGLHFPNIVAFSVCLWVQLQFTLFV